MESLIEANRYVKYPFSTSSLDKLKDVHPNLQRFAFALADIIDCKIVYGVRSDEEQNKLFKDEKSKCDGYIKKSAHQKRSDGYGHALDILPLPKGVNMYLNDGSEDNIRWGQFDGLCQGIAHYLDIKVKTGFKWKGSMMETLQAAERDNKFPDGNHIELVE